MENKKARRPERRNGKIIICKACCKPFYVPKHRLSKNVAYCSQKCRFEDLKIYNVCKVCGKRFWSPSRGVRPYCSKKCTGIAARKGHFITCEWCGKDVYKPLAFLQGKKHHFCSKWCADKYQGRKKISFICKICGKNFSWSKSRIETGNPTYCSMACRNKDTERLREISLAANLKQFRKKGPNRLELKGREILLDVGCEFEEQVSMFNKFLVDVLIPHKKLIIQWDGLYWHSKTKRKHLDRSQDAYFKKCGYSVLRITDKQIKEDIGGVYENIKEAIR